MADEEDGHFCAHAPELVIGVGVQKVRKTVEDAIDKLIEKTFAAVDWLKEKGKQAIDAVLNWWKADEEIKSDDGETHHIYLEGEPGSLKLTVAGTPMDAAAAIKVIDKNENLDTAEKSKFKAEANVEKDALEASVKKLEKLNRKETAGNLPSGAWPSQHCVKLPFPKLGLSCVDDSTVNSDRTHQSSWTFCDLRFEIGQRE